MAKYLVIIVVFLLLSLGVTGYFLNKALDKADRMESNYLAGQGMAVNELNLKLNEFKDYFDKKDSSLLQRVSDTLKMKIRARDLTQVNNYYYRNVDTMITELPLLQIDNAYPFIAKRGCLEIEGTFDINESKMFITRTVYNDTIVDVSGGKRPKVMKWLFGGIGNPFKKREPFNVVLSSCGGIISKKEINLIK